MKRIVACLAILVALTGCAPAAGSDLACQFGTDGKAVCPW